MRSCATVRDGGGAITERDLADYRVAWRRPVRVGYLGHEVISNPPPSSGGILIAYGLALLARAGHGDAGSAESIASLVEVMREQTRVREEGFTSGLHRGGLARRLLSDEGIARGLARMEEGAPGARRAGTRRHDPRVRGRLRRHRGVALVVHRLRLGRDRARHRHPSEQHARRVRPRGRRPDRARTAADEHDGAHGRGRRRRAAPRRRQRRVGAAARGDHAGDRARRRPRSRRRGRDRPSARAPRRAARALRGWLRSGGARSRWSRSATTSCAGAGATSSSAARTRSS